MLSMAEFPSPRGVGADLTVREGKHAVDGRVSVPSRGWGRSHTTCRSRFPARASSGFRPLAGLGQISQGVPHRVADDGRPGFRPLAGLGQISHYIRQYKHFADEFPSPRGVGADLTGEVGLSAIAECTGFRPLAGLGQISPAFLARDALLRLRVSVPSRGWGRSHRIDMMREICLTTRSIFKASVCVKLSPRQFKFKLHRSPQTPLNPTPCVKPLGPLLPHETQIHKAQRSVK